MESGVPPRTAAYIKSALRRIWRWSTPRRECLKAAKCAKCGKVVGKGGLYADHIAPVVDPTTGFTTWDDYIRRMFCGALQPLCKKCHAEKSKEEAGIRVMRRSALKQEADLCLAHRYLYYVEATPIIADQEYDRLERRVRESAPIEHPIHQPGSSLPATYQPGIIRLAKKLREDRKRSRTGAASQWEGHDV